MTVLNVQLHLQKLEPVHQHVQFPCTKVRQQQKKSTSEGFKNILELNYGKPGKKNESRIRYLIKVDPVRQIQYG